MIKEAPSIVEGEIVIQLQNKTSWLTPIKQYFQNGEELENKDKGRKLRNRVTRYTLVKGELYRHFLLCFI